MHGCDTFMCQTKKLSVKIKSIGTNVLCKTFSYKNKKSQCPQKFFDPTMHIIKWKWNPFGTKNYIYTSKNKFLVKKVSAQQNITFFVMSKFREK